MMISKPKIINKVFKGLGIINLVTNCVILVVSIVKLFTSRSKNL